MNLDSVVFVYQLKRKPYTSKCVYIHDDAQYVMDKRYKHVATLDPAMWIETLLNSGNKMEQIEKLFD